MFVHAHMAHAGLVGVFVEEPPRLEVGFGHLQLLFAVLLEVGVVLFRWEAAAARLLGRVGKLRKLGVMTEIGRLLSCGIGY